MKASDPLLERALAVAAGQAGVIARRQLISLGYSAMQARRGVMSGRWRVILRGVYATFTGPLPPTARIWAAVLYAGGGSAIGRETALWLAGMTSDHPKIIHVDIPADRQLKVPDWVQVHRHRNLVERIQPASAPPRVRLEDALLDACDATSSVDTCLTLIFTAIQRRLTTPAKLRRALDGRMRHRWRELIGGICHDAGEGVASALERRYLTDVEIRHRMPRAERNRPETDTSGSSVYRDARYEEWSVLVELDGREAHPPEKRYRDRRRDNRSVVAGDWTLRYGWHDVAGRPCEVALEVCTTLRNRGWTGWGRPCGPRCAVHRRPR